MQYRNMQHAKRRRQNPVRPSNLRFRGNIFVNRRYRGERGMEGFSGHVDDGMEVLGG